MIFSKREEGNVAIAIAIIIAGLLVAGAVVVTDNKEGGDVPEPTDNTQEETVTIPEVTEEDYVRGDVNAPITIVEYSDTECPFCKRLHGTLQELMSEYEGKIKWVYRNVPLHQKSMAEATAAECVAEQGGNDAYWTYLDSIYDNTEGNDTMDLSLLPVLAGEQGYNVEEFNTCLESGKYIEKVRAQGQDAFAAGAKGTPFSVIVAPNGDNIVISGAQPIQVWRQTIDAILSATE